MVLTVTITERVQDRLKGLSVGWRPFERAAQVPADRPNVVQLPRELNLEMLKDHPTVRAYRDLSWTLGVDPTKRRPAGEALARRVLARQELPRIHPLVDAYNRASAQALVPLSALDEDRVAGDLVLDLADQGEAFHGIAKDPEELAGNELVFRDDKGVVAVFLYRDSDRTKITDTTVRATVLACGAPDIQVGALRDALDLVEFEAREAGWQPGGPFVATSSS